MKGFMSCIVLPMVLKNTVSTLLRAVGIHIDPRSALLAVTCFVFVPLCLLRNLSFLSYASLVGVAGEMYAVAFVIVRSLDGTYREGGKFWTSTRIRYRPMWKCGTSSFVLISTVVFCYMAHYNAPKYCNVLRNATEERWKAASMISFGVVAIMYASVMIAGYATFGNESSSFLLDSYAEDDVFALVAHFAITVGVALCFPLIFTALRDGMFQVLELPKGVSQFYIVTLLLFIPTIGIAMLLDDIGIVNALTGSMFGSFISLVFPGMFVFYAADWAIPNSWERCAALLLIVFGLVLASLGTTNVILHALG